MGCLVCYGEGAALWSGGTNTLQPACATEADWGRPQRPLLTSLLGCCEPQNGVVGGPHWLAHPRMTIWGVNNPLLVLHTFVSLACSLIIVHVIS